jgi:hypothetical protein
VESLLFLSNHIILIDPEDLLVQIPHTLQPVKSCSVVCRLMTLSKVIIKCALGLIGYRGVSSSWSFLMKQNTMVGMRHSTLINHPSDCLFQMILLEPSNRILSDTLTERFANEPEKVLMNACGIPIFLL